MTVTRSQKVWLAVLGVAVVGLAVDQFTGGSAAGPAVALRAVMADLRAEPAAPAVVSPKPTEAAGLSGFDATLAARLDDLRHRRGDGGQGATRDAFAPPAGWAVDGPADGRAAAFERDHTLKATLQAGGGGQAVVDGDLVAVGQQLDGFRLASVGQRRATFFAADGARAELSLAAGGAADGR